LKVLPFGAGAQIRIDSLCLCVAGEVRCEVASDTMMSFKVIDITTLLPQQMMAYALLDGTGEVHQYYMLEVRANAPKCLKCRFNWSFAGNVGA
jgi:hypothetical protein